MARIPTSNLQTVSSQGASYRPQATDRSVIKGIEKLGEGAIAIAQTISDKKLESEINEKSTSYKVSAAEKKGEMENAVNAGDREAYNLASKELSSIDTQFETEMDGLGRGARNSASALTSASKVFQAKSGIRLEGYEAKKMDDTSEYNASRLLKSTMDINEYNQSIDSLTSKTLEEKRRLKLKGFDLTASSLSKMVAKNGLTESAKTIQKSLNGMKEASKEDKELFNSNLKTSEETYVNNVFSKMTKIPGDIEKELESNTSRDIVYSNISGKIEKLQATPTNRKFTQSIKDSLLEDAIAGLKTARLESSGTFSNVVLGDVVGGRALNPESRDKLIEAQAKLASGGNKNIEKKIFSNLKTQAVKFKADPASAVESTNQGIQAAARSGAPETIKLQDEAQQDLGIAFTNRKLVSPAFASSVKSTMKTARLDEKTILGAVDEYKKGSGDLWYKSFGELHRSGAINGSDIIIAANPSIAEDIAVYDRSYSSNLKNIEESKSAIRKEAVADVQGKFEIIGESSPAFTMYQGITDTVAKANAYALANNGSKSELQDEIYDSFSYATSGDSVVIIPKSAAKIDNKQMSEVVSSPLKILTNEFLNSDITLDLNKQLAGLRSVKGNPNAKEEWAKAGFRSGADYVIAQDAVKTYNEAIDLKSKSNGNDQFMIDAGKKYREALGYYDRSVGIQMSNDIEDPNKISFYTNSDKQVKMLFNKGTLSLDPTSAYSKLYATPNLKSEYVKGKVVRRDNTFPSSAAEAFNAR